MGKTFLLDIWVGNFESEARLDAYFEENYDEDDAPISEFAADMGVSFYDHDFLESSFHQTSTDDIAIILEGHSGCDSEAVLSQAQVAFVAHKTFVNAATLVLNDERDFPQFQNPKSIAKPGASLFYLGRFETSL